MPVNINSLTLSTPVPTSATNPVALELSGAEAIARFPELVTVLPDGSIRLTAPTKGASSKSTHRTRCEWKEPIYWTTSSATEHLNYQEMTLVQVNSLQKVVISQLHVKDDDSPPIKVFWNKAKISYAFRQSFNLIAPASITLLSNVPLGAKFTVTIRVTSTGAAEVSASCNGASAKTGVLQLDPSWGNQTLNFHGGVYNQVDYSASTPDTDRSVCIISDLLLRHG